MAHMKERLARKRRTSLVITRGDRGRKEKGRKKGETLPMKRRLVKEKWGVNEEICATRSGGEKGGSCNAYVWKGSSHVRV